MRNKNYVLGAIFPWKFVWRTPSTSLTWLVQVRAIIAVSHTADCCGIQVTSTLFKPVSSTQHFSLNQPALQVYLNTDTHLEPKTWFDHLLRMIRRFPSLTINSYYVILVISS